MILADISKIYIGPVSNDIIQIGIKIGVLKKIDIGFFRPSDIWQIFVHVGQISADIYSFFF